MGQRELKGVSCMKSCRHGGREVEYGWRSLIWSEKKFERMNRDLKIERYGDRKSCLRDIFRLFYCWIDKSKNIKLLYLLR